MQTMRILLALLGLSVATLVAAGQEAGDVPESPPPAVEPAGDAPESPSPAAAEPAANAPPRGAAAEGASANPPPASRAPAETVPRDAADEVFVPSVEVQADQEVVFPVDI